MDENTSQVEYTIAGNMGNMIGQLSLQVAKLQTVVKLKNEEIEKNQNTIAELNHQIDRLRGGGNSAKRQISAKRKQN